MENTEIEIVCLMDSDGHFRSSFLYDRKQVWYFIREILDDGDLWEDVKGEHVIENITIDDNTDYNMFSVEHWKSLVNLFCSRGSMEIVTV